MRIFFVFLLFLAPLKADEFPKNPRPQRIQRRGRAAIDSSGNFIAYSMIAWGIGLGVTAAVLAGFFQGSSAD